MKDAVELECIKLTGTCKQFKQKFLLKEANYLTAVKSKELTAPVSQEAVIVRITLFPQIKTTHKEAEYEMLADETSLSTIADVILSLCNVDSSLFGEGTQPWQFYIEDSII